MAYNSEAPRVEYTSSIGQTVFTFLFKAYKETDIVVYQTLEGVAPDDTADVLTLTTDYTVVINGDNGGTVTLVTPTTSQDSFTILRQLPQIRDVDYQTGGDLLADTLDEDQNYQTYLIADQAEKENRSLTLANSVQGVSTELPVPEALKLMRWKASEDGLENVTIGDNDTFINIFNIDTIADLSSVDITLYETVNVRGYNTANDGGGGIFNYDSSQSATNNGGTIIDGWVRQYDGLLDYKWFGLSAFEFFVATTGSDSNNGLLISTPFLTIQKAIDTYATFRRDIGEDCTIYLADGTYTEGGVVDGIESDASIIIEGVSKVGTIIDGTTAVNSNGLNFNTLNGNARVKKITSKNFSGNGIVFQNGTVGVIDECDTLNNNSGAVCSEYSDMTILGACTFGDNATGESAVRYYRNSTGSIGDGTNLVTVRNMTLGAGFLIRDGSFVVCNDNVTMDSNSKGIALRKGSYIELRDSTVSNNVDGIYADTFSIFDNASGIITFTTNTRDKRFIEMSLDRSGINDSSDIPYWLRAVVPSGLTTSSGYDMVLDSNAETGLQFLTNGNNARIDFDKISRISHVASDSTLRMTVSGAEYRMRSAAFYPSTDSDKNLGQSFAKWDNVYGITYYSGASAGVSGTFTSNDGKTITVTGGIITAIV